jgi:hypothetical protein
MRFAIFKRRKKYIWTAKRKAKARYRAYKRYKGVCVFCGAPVLTNKYVWVECGRYNKWFGVAHKRCAYR